MLACVKLLLLIAVIFKDFNDGERAEVDLEIEPLSGQENPPSVLLDASEEKALHERFRRAHAASILSSSAVELAGPLILSKEMKVVHNADRPRLEMLV